MIIQLNPPIEVKTPLGKGWALLVIDYSININSIWVVSLNSNGQIKHFESNDIFVVENPMLGHKKNVMELPAKYKIGETVTVGETTGSIEHIRFTDSKVYYGVLVEVPSDLINPPADSGSEGE